MGLDNGIRLRMSKELAARAPIWMLGYLDDIETLPNGETDGEICYWRKCWGYRGAMMDITRGRFNENGDTKLTFTDCEKFLEVVEQSFDSTSDIDDNGDYTEPLFKFDDDCYSSCWDAREVVVSYLRMTYHLQAICNWLRDNASPDDYELYFYDSY